MYGLGETIFFIIYITLIAIITIFKISKNHKLLIEREKKNQKEKNKDTRKIERHKE